MKVDNIRIYDLEETLIASGYPMRTTLGNRTITQKDIERAMRLTRACDVSNQAHGQYMTGIRVAFDLTFSNKAWVEAERYRFLEFVSSQSTMHRITSFDLSKQYNSYVDPRIIAIMKEKVAEYKWIKETLEKATYEEDREMLEKKAAEKYLEILYSNPAGFKITARLTTNYRCLRNIWLQRKNHRLPEWKIFCKWIETLPFAKQLICYEKGSPAKITSEEFFNEMTKYIDSFNIEKYKWEWENENVESN